MEKELRKLGADFARSALRPNWELLDGADPALLDEILRAAAAAGIFGFAIPESAGGSGLGAAEYALFIEEVARAGGSVAALLAAHFAGLAPLLQNEGDKAKAILSEATAAEANGEPALFIAAVRERANAEFNGSRIQTILSSEGGRFLLNGKKTGVPGASAAKRFIVLARNAGEGALCWASIPCAADGVEICPEKDRLGLRACPVNDVIFSGAEVSADAVFPIPPGGEPMAEFHSFADPPFAAVSIGMAAEAREVALKYAIDRRQGGKMICDHDVVRLMLADMETRIRASRSLAYGKEGGYLAAAFAAEAAEAVCLDAMQTLGGYGYMKDYPIERMLRDVKTFRATLDFRSRKIECVEAEIKNMK